MSAVGGCFSGARDTRLPTPVMISYLQYAFAAAAAAAMIIKRWRSLKRLTPGDDNTTKRDRRPGGWWRRRRGELCLSIIMVVINLVPVHPFRSERAFCWGVGRSEGVVPLPTRKDASPRQLARVWPVASQCAAKLISNVVLESTGRLFGLRNPYYHNPSRRIIRPK